MGQTREERIIKQLTNPSSIQKHTAIAGSGDSAMFLPNHSGISSHPEFKKALSAVGGSQTPWTSNIDGAYYNLSNVNQIILSLISTPENFSYTTIAGSYSLNGNINYKIYAYRTIDGIICYSSGLDGIVGITGSNQGARLNWNAVTGAEGYIVYRVASGLSNDEPYYYNVVGTNTLDDTEYNGAGWTLGIPVISSFIKLTADGKIIAKTYYGDGSKLTGVIKDLSTSTTDNLTEGSINFYWTDDRINNFWSSKSTDDLTEGSTNRYLAALTGTDVTTALGYTPYYQKTTSSAVDSIDFGAQTYTTITVVTDVS